jgi:hypothetical protein
MASQHQTIYGAENKKINEETRPERRGESPTSPNHEDGSNDQNLESATRKIRHIFREMAIDLAPEWILERERNESSR